MCSRRQPVASGGLLSTHKATVSKETQDLLKGSFGMNNVCFYSFIVMMKESQLTNFQIRQLDQKMKSKFIYVCIVLTHVYISWQKCMVPF